MPWVFGENASTLYQEITEQGYRGAVVPYLRTPELPEHAAHGGVRGCIIPDPGHVLISADFAGIELRVTAALSGDAQLARIITEDDAAKAQDPNAKTDIHWKIAHQVFGLDATYADRYVVNPMVFTSAPGCAGINHADFTATGRTAVFTCEFAGRVAVIDVASHRLLRLIDMPHRSTHMGPQDIKLAPDGSVLHRRLPTKRA